MNFKLLRMAYKFHQGSCLAPSLACHAFLCAAHALLILICFKFSFFRITCAILVLGQPFPAKLSYGGPVSRDWLLTSCQVSIPPTSFHIPRAADLLPLFLPVPWPSYPHMLRYYPCRPFSLSQHSFPQS